MSRSIVTVKIFPQNLTLHILQISYTYTGYLFNCEKKKTMPEICKKTVLGQTDSLTGYRFLIKDYQRGYRWGKREIVDLLNDLDEFGNKDTTLKYCLQPLVVKEVDENNCFEVIDGQQRLTTIKLIINICQSVFANKKDAPYNIDYDYERHLDKKYKQEAENYINEWFNSSGDLADDKKSDILRKINSRILFIWYKVDGNTSSEELFSKINIGKIQLTNAELFKAVLLNPDNISDDKKVNLDKIAFEWDKIEQSLHNDDFWFFLSNDKRASETRIDYLLKLYALQKNEQYPELSKQDLLFAFNLVSNEIKQEQDSFEVRQKIWEEIIFIHDKIKSFYDDFELFHYVGYLATVSKNTTETVSEIITATSGYKQSEIKKYIIDKIKKEFFTEDEIDNFDYENENDIEKIRKVLLLFNLRTKIEDQEAAKFSFKQYKEAHWDLEHIHARAAGEAIKKMKKDEKEKLFKPLDPEWEQKNEAGLCTLLAENSVQDENGIENLTLLNYRTNREYKNEPFNKKRNIIIEKCKTDTFVPVCTKNVFLKMYSENPEKMTVWTQSDADAYLNAIKTTLKDFWKQEK